MYYLSLSLIGQSYCIVSLLQFWWWNCALLPNSCVAITYLYGIVHVLLMATVFDSFVQQMYLKASQNQ